MEFEILSTERLFLRKLTQEVFDYIFSNFSDDEIKIFFNIDSDELYKKEKAKFEKGLSIFNKSFLYFQLIDKQNNLVIGWCGFHTWYLDHDRAEIGYVINDDSYKAKGIMTEAIKPIVDYGFSKMNLHRIEAFVGKENNASLNVLRRLNFKQEGILKEHYKVKDKMEDSILLALLKSEHYKR